MAVLHDGYGTQKVKEDIGETFTLVLWHEVGTLPKELEINTTQMTGNSVVYLPEIGAIIVKVPVDGTEVGGKELFFISRYK